MIWHCYKIQHKLLVSNRNALQLKIRCIARADIQQNQQKTGSTHQKSTKDLYTLPKSSFAKFNPYQRNANNE